MRLDPRGTWQQAAGQASLAEALEVDNFFSRIRYREEDL
jgi:hypothetical protein